VIGEAVWLDNRNVIKKRSSGPVPEGRLDMDQ
jgi:hypothetical protein